MPMFEDIRTSATGISEYLNTWIDHYARSHGKSGRDNLSAEEERQAVRSLCSHMYENLSILDTKSSGLIGSNAITTAIFALLALSPSSAGTLFAATNVVRIVSMGFLIISLISLILNVSVLVVYWSTTTEYSEATSTVDRARSLIRIRNGRTRRYRVAFVIHLAILCLALTLFVAILLKALPL